MKPFNPKEFTSGALAQHSIEGGYDEIRFEGILCSAEFNSTTGEKSYFTVDTTGKVLNIFDKAEHSNPSFNICMKETDVIEIMPNGKPRMVEVVRFFRTWDYYNDQINSSGGMTAICVMDYKLKTITVYPSFCHPEDNFDKAVGLIIAKANQSVGNGFSINMTSNVTLRSNIESAIFNKSAVWLNTESSLAFANPLSRFIND